ncbi:MAG: hypothetical protein GY852_01190 [bacterium]|nr:hypothetical protein [bacterium]
MKTLFTTALTFALIACETAEPATTNTATEPIEATNSVLHLQTEIGVELGDSNYVFGVIQGVDFTADGNVAVLDTQKKRVNLFSPDGNFLGSCGGEGEAPGEFLNPHGITCLNNGTIAVTDPFSREVELFGADLQHQTTYSNFDARAPFVIAAAGNGFAGEQGGFNRTEGILTISVALWEEGTDSTRIFVETEDTFSPENMIQRIMLPQAGLTADETNIYYSAPISQNYSVSVFPIDGAEASELSFPQYSPVPKTEEDIQKDIQAYEYRMQGMAAAGRGGRLAGADYEPSQYYYATSSLGVDSEGNIWVQRGWESNPTFDLFPPGASEPVETVTVDPALDLEGFNFAITPEGIAAYNMNPEDFPKVLILTL